MTWDPIDAYAEAVASHAMEMLGLDEAPGALLQAMLIASGAHGLDATVLALERTVADLRAKLAASIKPEGSIQ